MVVIDFSAKTSALKKIQISLSIVVPLFLCLVCYWPGLASDFLLDDFVNLQPLAIQAELTPDLPLQEDQGEYSRVVNFVFSGNAGPTGRPLGLLSLLINDNAWPSNPWSYKYTNLLIHCINGLLIFLISFNLTSAQYKDSNKSVLIASVCAVLWLCHPIQVSTVLYVIQRMTLLSSFFCLLGILAYIYGRQRLQVNCIQGLLVMSCSIMGFGALAIISKENGVLLFAYIGLIELVMRPLEGNEKFALKRWRLVFVGLPLLIVLSYLLYRIPSFNLIYQNRSYTLIERLLTESRVVSAYIYDIFIPKMTGLGLFHDDYTVSSSLITPITTLFSVIFITVSLLLSWRVRRQYPVVTFGVFWFYSGHLLESTFIPLELYFEHRNYLPLFGIVFVLVSLIFHHAVLARIRYLVSGMAVLICCVLTLYQTQLWGRPHIAYDRWVAEHPRSIRAIRTAATYQLSRSDGDKAAQLYQQGFERTGDAGLLMDMFIFDCYTNQAGGRFSAAGLELLPQAKIGFYNTSAVVSLSGLLIKNNCSALNNNAAQTLAIHFIEKEKLLSPHANYVAYYLLGLTYIRQENLIEAQKAWDRSFTYHNDINIPIQLAELLLKQNNNDQAKKYINIAQRLNETLTLSHKQTGRLAPLLDAL